jgi:AraC-like DNA-binding protein
MSKNGDIAYIRTQQAVANPGLLEVCWHGQPYRFVVQTAHNSERHIRLPRRPIEHVHDVYHIVIFTEGRNHCQYRSQVIATEPGTIILSSPGEPHDFGPLDDGLTIYHEVTFTLTNENGKPLVLPFSKMLELYVGEELPALDGPFMLKSREIHWLSLMVERLLDWIYRREIGADFTIQRIVLEMFSLLVQEIFLPYVHTEALPSGSLQHAKDYLDIHYAGKVDVEALAHKAHISKEHFCRVFKAHFGQSPMAYKQERRISSACNLLRSTNLQCQEIADRLGFADMYTFSRAFKKLTGQSPRHFRQSSV